MNIRWEHKSEDEIEKLAYGWYNPPEEECISEFLAEYGEVVKELAEVLNTFGTAEIDPEYYEGDFIMGLETDLTRTVFIVCKNPKVFSHKIAESLITLLKSFEQDYLLVLDGQFSHGDSFYICVEKSGVKHWAVSPEKLSVFRRAEE